ncbi:hypothetical protein [Caulobacter sp.]|jgi:hypothetical protein|uniref:hypothetical protein n=1 Tax=Caulobacter sp. TaxID=78 RepID=UPI00160CCE85
MKSLASFSLAAVTLFAAAPALAGPAGHGLTFTEEVHKKRMVSVQASIACAAPAAATLRARTDVAKVQTQDGLVHVTFRNASAAKSQARAVRAQVSEICRTA